MSIFGASDEDSVILTSSSAEAINQVLLDQGFRPEEIAHGLEATHSGEMIDGIVSEITQVFKFGKKSCQSKHV